MRRVLRVFYTGCTVLSLLLFLVSITFALRSYWVEDIFLWDWRNIHQAVVTGNDLDIHSVEGRLLIDWQFSTVELTSPANVARLNPPPLDFFTHESIKKTVDPEQFHWWQGSLKESLGFRYWSIPDFCYILADVAKASTRPERDLPGDGSRGDVSEYTKIPREPSEIELGLGNVGIARLPCHAGWYSLGLPTWLLVVAFSVLPLLQFVAQIRRRKRAASGKCPICSYDLRAHQPGQKCPECGTLIGAQNKNVMTATPSKPT